MRPDAGNAFRDRRTSRPRARAWPGPCMADPSPLPISRICSAAECPTSPRNARAFRKASQRPLWVNSSLLRGHSPLAAASGCDGGRHVVGRQRCFLARVAWVERPCGVGDDVAARMVVFALLLVGGRRFVSSPPGSQRAWCGGIASAARGRAVAVHDGRSCPGTVRVGVAAIGTPGSRSGTGPTHPWGSPTR